MPVEVLWCVITYNVTRGYKRCAGTYCLLLSSGRTEAKRSAQALARTCLQEPTAPQYNTTIDRVFSFARDMLLSSYQMRRKFTVGFGLHTELLRTEMYCWRCWPTLRKVCVYITFLSNRKLFHVRSLSWCDLQVKTFVRRSSFHKLHKANLDNTGPARHQISLGSVRMNKAMAWNQIIFTGHLM
jgi:hypothetical protein